MLKLEYAQSFVVCFSIFIGSLWFSPALRDIFVKHSNWKWNKEYCCIFMIHQVMELQWSQHPEIIIALVVSNCFSLIKCFILDCFSHANFKRFKIIVCKTNLLDKIVKLCLIVYISICFVILTRFFINYHTCTNKLYSWWRRVELKYLWMCMKGPIKFNTKESKRHPKENCFNKARVDTTWTPTGIPASSFASWYSYKIFIWLSRDSHVH